MTFRNDRPLDPSQVQDVRGGGLGGPVLVGGGGIGIIILIASLLLGVDPTGILQSIDTTGSGTIQNGPTASDCQTGSQANERDDCRVVGFVNSVQQFWSDEFAKQGKTYAPATTVLFSQYWDSACGTAQTAMGPFYCPNDGKVYLDILFFQDLRTQLGAQGGPFAQGYVVAHEYGHHVQDLLGALSQQSSRTGATSQSVRTELQADCYAGVWAAHAADTGYLQPPTQAEINDALDSAAAVGDDRIQKETQGRVAPDSFTHGTSAQRQHWFLIGYQTGDPARCDTSGAL